MTFLHSGAMGDLVYGLVAIKAMGGGTLFVSRRSRRFRGLLDSEQAFSGLRTLLTTQTYIHEVSDVKKGVGCDCNLNAFRRQSPARNHLALCHLTACGVSADISVPWIDRERVGPSSVAEIVISRSTRRKGSLEWTMLRPWSSRCVFLGLECEHEQFLRDTGLSVRREPIGDAYEMAKIIAGARLFVGNQSFPYSLAEAMKINRILEVCDVVPNCMPHGGRHCTRLDDEFVRSCIEPGW